MLKTKSIRKTLNQNNIESTDIVLNKVLKPLGLLSDFVSINYDKPELQNINTHDTVYFFTNQEYKKLFIESKYNDSSEYNSYSVFFNGDKWQYTWLKEYPNTFNEPSNVEVMESKEYDSYYNALIELMNHIIKEYLEGMITINDFN